VVLAGLSNPYRRNAGGSFGQARRHLRHSGPRMLAYLLVNMAVPRLVGALTGGLAALCRRLGIPVVTVEDVNGPAFRAALRAAAPDLIVTFHFDQILHAETLAPAPLGGLNVHPSLLPHHRGPIPTFWAAADAARGAAPDWGVTIHRLAPQIDAGPILGSRPIALPPGLTASAAARHLHRAAVPVLEEALARLGAGTAEERTATPLPYRPFPSRAALREARGRGARLVGVGDLLAALRIRG